MGLMSGTGPLGRRPAGMFNFTPPEPGQALYLEPTPRRIRVLVGGETIVDSRRAMLLHESGHQPVYYFPPADVRMDLLEPSDRHTRCPKKGEASYHTVRVGDRVVEAGAWYYPELIDGAPTALQGMIAFYWNRMDHWLEEDEEVFVHPRDPYHRVDIVQSDRHVRVSLDGEVLAESSRALALFESNLPTRWYLPREDVRVEFDRQRHDHPLSLQGRRQLPLGRGSRGQGSRLVLSRSDPGGHPHPGTGVLLQRARGPRARRRAAGATRIALEPRRQVRGGESPAGLDARLGHP